jgi:Zn-dependent alcohol dehydrogenase
MEIRAAVLHAVSKPLVVERIELTSFAPHDVLVRVRASGLCHTDLEVMRGSLQLPILGKTAVDARVSLRFGSLMGKKRIVRSSYGGARPRVDFPRIARAYLDGTVLLDELITRRLALAEINEGFEGMERGEVTRAVVVC